VPGHFRVEGNETADALAKRISESRTSSWCTGNYSSHRGPAVGYQRAS